MRIFRHDEPEREILALSGTKLAAAATILTFTLAVTACSTPMYPRKLVTEIEAEKAQKLLSLEVPATAPKLPILETAAGPTANHDLENADSNAALLDEDTPAAEYGEPEQLAMTAGPDPTVALAQTPPAAARPVPGASLSDHSSGHEASRPDADHAELGKLDRPQIATAARATPATDERPTEMTTPPLVKDNPVLSQATLRIARFDPEADPSPDSPPGPALVSKATQQAKSPVSGRNLGEQGFDTMEQAPKDRSSETVRNPAATEPGPAFMATLPPRSPAPPPSDDFATDPAQTMPAREIAETRLVPPPPLQAPQIASTTADLPKAIEPPPLLTGLQVQFGPGSSELPEAAQNRLTALAKQLSQSANSRLRLSSLTMDDDLSAGQARRLTLSRLFSVRNFLIAQGLRSDQMDLLPMGGTDDEAPADRVELVIERS